MASNPPIVVVEDDPWARLIGVVLDPTTSEDDPTSRMKIVCVPCERTGMLFRPLKSPTTELTGTIGQLSFVLRQLEIAESD
jgi:hypothetical protein